MVLNVSWVNWIWVFFTVVFFLTNVSHIHLALSQCNAQWEPFHRGSVWIDIFPPITRLLWWIISDIVWNWLRHFCERKAIRRERSPLWWKEKLGTRVRKRRRRRAAVSGCVCFASSIIFRSANAQMMKYSLERYLFKKGRKPLQQGIRA